MHVLALKTENNTDICNQILIPKILKSFVLGNVIDACTMQNQVITYLLEYVVFPSILLFLM